MSNAEQINNRLMSHIISFNVKGDKGRQQRGFMAARVFDDFKRRDQITTHEIERFLGLYSTPQAYWRSATRFVEISIDVEGQHTKDDVAAKRREYYDSLSKLGSTMFGRKWKEFVKGAGLEAIEPEVAVSSISSYGHNDDAVMEPVIMEARDQKRYKNVAIAVFDGVGGEKGGRLAAEIVKKRARKNIMMTLGGDKSFVNAIVDTINESSASMETEYEDDYPNMSTTFAMAAMSGDKKRLFVAHGGDSKIAALDEKGNIIYLTRDHNSAYKEAADDKISRDEWIDICSVLDHATDISDIPAKYRKYWDSDEKGRHLISVDIRKNMRTTPEQVNDIDFIESIPVDQRWVCILGLTDGVTDNLTPREISKVMGAEDLISGKITLSQSLDLLTRAAKNKAALWNGNGNNNFRSKPDAGISATGFTI